MRIVGKIVGAVLVSRRLCDHEWLTVLKVFGEALESFCQLIEPHQTLDMQCGVVSMHQEQINNAGFM